MPKGHFFHCVCFIFRLAPDQVDMKIEASLKSLKRDSVDLYYLHAPDAKTNIEDTLKEVNRLHVSGKIKALGLSNFQVRGVSVQSVRVYTRLEREGHRTLAGR